MSRLSFAAVLRSNAQVLDHIAEQLEVLAASTEDQETDALLRLAHCTRQLSGEYYAGMGWTNSGSVSVSAEAPK